MHRLISYTQTARTRQADGAAAAQQGGVQLGKPPPLCTQLGALRRAVLLSARLLLSLQERPRPGCLLLSRLCCLGHRLLLRQQCTLPMLLLRLLRLLGLLRMHLLDLLGLLRLLGKLP